MSVINDGGQKRMDIGGGASVNGRRRRCRRIFV